MATKLLTMTIEDIHEGEAMLDMPVGAVVYGVLARGAHEFDLEVAADFARRYEVRRFVFAMVGRELGLADYPPERLHFVGKTLHGVYTTHVFEVVP